MSTPTDTFPEIFNGRFFFPIDPTNVRTKFEVRKSVGEFL